MKIGIIVLIHRTEPKIVVERWELRRHRPHSYNIRSLGAMRDNDSDDSDQTTKVPTMVQEIAITLQQSTGTITPIGGPLVIPFHKLVPIKKRAPETSQCNFTYSAVMLMLEKEIVKEVWESQGFLPVDPRNTYDYLFGTSYLILSYLITARQRLNRPQLEN